MHPPRRLLAGLGMVIGVALGCEEPVPTGGSYYQERIEPILQIGCMFTTSGCHVESDGEAAGNLDLTSYDSLMRRRDTLPAYGPYSVGLFLLKGAGPESVTVDTLDPPDPAHPDQRFVEIQTDIRHAGGFGLEIGSPGFATLREWINDGFQRFGTPVSTDRENSGDCNPAVGDAAGFDPAAVPEDSEAFTRFVEEVQPVLRESCAGSQCHGAALADLHLSCGDDDAQLRWNYFIASAHLNESPQESELLQKPLAVSRGGTFHGGGDTFDSVSHNGYEAMLGWANERLAGSAGGFGEELTDGYRFFVNRVQPTLVRKGCMALNCHSPISLKFNLRGGSSGSFSQFARTTNYRLAKKLLAFESANPNNSRLVAKNLFPPETVSGGQGIAHRGGSLLEDFTSASGSAPARVEQCEAWDADSDDLNEIPAYCVLARWHEIERQTLVEQGLVDSDDALVRGVVYVVRPMGTGGATDFDVYRPGADLRLADAHVELATEELTLGESSSLLDGCGLTPATTDIRGTTVSWDGEWVAFGARGNASAPLRIHRVRVDGTDCEQVPNLAAAEPMRNGILTHDFDPAFAPDDRLVFASTRGNILIGGYGYEGPTLTPARLEPNANLYVFDETETDQSSRVRQLTFLLNQEVQPAFMADGRVIFTAEKREPGLHQLALKRQILDGGDFHPLYAQRPSLGFSSATEVAMLPNLNFVFVASELGMEGGAGTIAFFNRSIGPDQDDRDPNDRAFVHSMQVPLPGLLGGLRGAFRSPTPLPTGRVLASCQPELDTMRGDIDFGLCEIDPNTARARMLVDAPGLAEVEAVAVYQRPNRGVLRSDGKGIDRPLIVGGARDAVVHWNDFPMIASLMFSNTRTGRPIDNRIDAIEILESLPPPAGVTSFDDVSAQVETDDFGPMFLDRRSLGEVPLFEDGSGRMRVPGGVPLVFRLLGDGEVLRFEAGSPFEGQMIQREQEQYYPGERIQRSIPRRFFNSVCGGCHGSISGRELDIAVDMDVITGASINEARDADATDIVGDRF